MNRRADYALCICVRENLEGVLWTVCVNIRVNSPSSFSAEEDAKRQASPEEDQQDKPELFSYRQQQPL